MHGGTSAIIVLHSLRKRRHFCTPRNRGGSLRLYGQGACGGGKPGSVSSLSCYRKCSCPLAVLDGWQAVNDFSHDQFWRFFLESTHQQHRLRLTFRVLRTDPSNLPRPIEVCDPIRPLAIKRQVPSPHAEREVHHLRTIRVSWFASPRPLARASAPAASCMSATA